MTNLNGEPPEQIEAFGDGSPLAGFEVTLYGRIGVVPRSLDVEE